MHLLVIRFSAMGDVALTAPVVHSLLERNPALKITFVSNKAFEPFFNRSDRFSFHPAELKTKHKGAGGLFELFKELKTQPFDAVVDLHDVLRSRILCTYFKGQGKRIIRFNKGRSEKKKLLKPDCGFKPLPHTTARYFEAFQSLGLSIGMTDDPWKKPDSSGGLNEFFTANRLSPEAKLIGIAPFALHESKIWGSDKIDALIGKLKEEDLNNILLFGGRNEIDRLQRLQENHPEVVIVAGQLELNQELELMKMLRVMVSMDSSNMHLMSILGKKVVSIWGGTHHFLGFGPLGNEELIVEVPRETLPCRPCTIYGKTDSQKQRDCAKAAMDGITVDQVLEKIRKVLL